MIIKYLTIDELSELIAGSKRSVSLLGHRIEVTAAMVKELTLQRTVTVNLSNGIGRHTEVIKLAIMEDEE